MTGRLGLALALLLAAAGVRAARSAGAADDAQLTVHVEQTVQLEIGGRTIVLTPGASDYRLPSDQPIRLLAGQALLKLGTNVFRAHAGDGFVVRTAEATRRLSVLSGRIDEVSDAGGPLSVSASDTLTLAPPRLQGPPKTEIEKGIAAMNAGQVQKAITILEREAHRDPGSASALMNLGWASWKAGRLEEAGRCWSTLLELDPNNPGYLRMLAGVELERKDYAKALELTQQALQALPGDRDTTLVMARALSELHREDEALRLLRTLPDDPQVRFQLAQLWVKLGRLKEGLRMFDALVQSDPGNAEFRRQRARLLYDMGKTDRAVSEWRRLADAKKPDLPSLQELARAYGHAGRLDDAYRQWSRLSAIDPSSGEYLQVLASLDLQRRDYEAALEHTRRALANDPEDREAVILRARALARIGREPQALQILQRVLEEHPDRLDARLEVAGVYTEMGRIDDAMVQYAVLSRLDPANPLYQKRRAAALFSFGQYDKSLEAWRKVSELQPKDPEALMNIGWCQVRLAKVDEAARTWMELSTMDPKNPVYLRLLADAEIEKKNYQKAQSLAEKALESQPKDPQSRMTLAKVLIHEQRLAEARAIYEGLVAESPSDLSARFQLAALEIRQDKLEDALAQDDELIKLSSATPAYQDQRAYVLYELRRYDEALAVWRGLAARQPPDNEAVDRLIDDAVNRNDNETAYHWLQVKAANQPLDLASWMRLARVCEYSNRFGEAEQAANSVIDMDPISLDGPYLKADVLDHFQRYDLSEAIYEDIYKKNTNSSLAVLELAWNAESRGDPKAAYDWLLKLRDPYSVLYTSSPFLLLQQARLLADEGRLTEALGISEDVQRTHAGAVPVILYHGIGRTDRENVISKERFREQMDALRRAGFRSITTKEYLQMVRGELPVTGKPILITFDDARIDAFEYGDPILAEMGLKATMFVHLVGVRKGIFHASFDEIRHYARTGRWDMQSHGDDAHIMIPVDAQGHMGHFLISRMWLADKGRVETLGEYRKRIEQDLKHSKEVIEREVGKPVFAFAFPFSAFGQGDNAEAVIVNRTLAERYYKVSFIQDARGYNDATTRPSENTRFEVPKDMTGEQLVQHILLSSPDAQAKLLQARVWLEQDQPVRALAIADELAAQGVDAPELWAMRGQAYQKLGDPFTARTLYVKAENAAPEEDSYRALDEGAQRDANPKLSGSADGFTDNSSRSYVRAVGRIDASVRAFSVGGWYGGGPTSEPLAPRMTALERGLELRFPVTTRAQITGDYLRRQFSQGVAPQSDNFMGQASVALAPGVQAIGGWAQDHLPTAAAAFRGISYDNTFGQMNWTLGMDWAAFGRYDSWRYSDGNLRNDLRLQLSRAFNAGPVPFSVGYQYWTADSSLPTPVYWTPSGLREHLLMLVLTRSAPPDRGLNARLEWGGGYGTQTTSQGFVQSLKLQFGSRLWRYLDWTVGGEYQKTPSYTSGEALLGFGLSY